MRAPRSRSRLRLSVAFPVTELFFFTMLAIFLLIPLVTPRLLHLPLDTYAFPKYRVNFLNALPVRNDTAQRWLQDGLRGGEPEFLDQPWKGGEDWMTMKIGSADTQALVCVLLAPFCLIRDNSCLAARSPTSLPAAHENRSTTFLSVSHSSTSQPSATNG